MITKDYYEIVLSRVPERDKEKFNKDLIECIRINRINTLIKIMRINREFRKIVQMQDQ